MKKTTKVLRLLMQDPERKFSNTEISENTGLNKRQVADAMASLIVAWKLVKREYGNPNERKKPVYWINPEKKENVLKMLNRPGEEQ